MGSPLRLTLPGSSNGRADAGWRIVEATFRDTERNLTRFESDSPLSRLNIAAGRAVEVPEALARALSVAWRAFGATHGRFDPRIVGALEHAGERAGVDLPPSPRRLEPNERWLCLDPRSRLARISAPIDLGGIGKGMALRWAARGLLAAGCADFLLQAGGDLVGRGLGPGGRPWIVGIEDPGGSRRPIVHVELRDSALATSSAEVRRWQAPDGALRHHLIDPATGQPADRVWLSVTVRHTDPVWAEVHTKVGFLAGAHIGRVLAGVDAWWVGPGGAVHTT